MLTVTINVPSGSNFITSERIVGLEDDEPVIHSHTRIQDPFSPNSSFQSVRADAEDEVSR